MKIKDLMSRDLIVCDTDDNIIFISNLMRKYDVGMVLVTSNDKLVGLITDRDIVCSLFLDNTYSIQNYSKPIIHIEENDSIEKALKIMGKYKIKRLIVCEKDIVKGVLSLSDIINNYKSDLVLETIKEIFAIKNNNHSMKISVREFKL